LNIFRTHITTLKEIQGPTVHIASVIRTSDYRTAAIFLLLTTVN